MDTCVICIKCYVCIFACMLHVYTSIVTNDVWKTQHERSD